MRIVFVFMMLISFVSIKAQIVSGSYTDHLQLRSFNKSNQLKDSTQVKKWFMQKYIGVFSNFGILNGGNAMILSVPIGLQLNRRLHNNWYAFAGVSVAPAYTNFNHPFLSTNTNKFAQNNYLFTSKRLDLYSRAELGMMYINDQKTFSISGSIGIERSNYPVVPFNQTSPVRQHNFISPKQ